MSQRIGSSRLCLATLAALIAWVAIAPAGSASAQGELRTRAPRRQIGFVRTAHPRPVIAWKQLRRPAIRRALGRALASSGRDAPAVAQEHLTAVAGQPLYAHERVAMERATQIMERRSNETQNLRWDEARATEWRGRVFDMIENRRSREVQGTFDTFEMLDTAHRRIAGRNHIDPFRAAALRGFIEEGFTRLGQYAENRVPDAIVAYRPALESAVSLAHRLRIHGIPPIEQAARRLTELEQTSRIPLPSSPATE